jgi:hypothetical protein
VSRLRVWLRGGAQEAPQPDPPTAPIPVVPVGDESLRASVLGAVALAAEPQDPGEPS